MADFRCAVIGTAFKPNYKCLFFTFTENTQPGNLESFIFQHVLCKYGSLFRSGESIGDRFGFILGRWAEQHNLWAEPMKGCWVGFG